MRWAKSEYILKGVFLGLLLFVSLQKGLDWEATGRVAVWLVGGFLAALILAAARQLRDIKGLGRNPVGFVLFLLLENPFLIYMGIVLGMAGAAIDYLYHLKAAYGEADLPPEANVLGYCAFGGAVFGYGISELRQIAHPLYRLGITAILCAARRRRPVLLARRPELPGRRGRAPAVGRPPLARHPVLLPARVLRDGRGVRGRDRGPVRHLRARHVPDQVPGPDAGPRGRFCRSVSTASTRSG